MERDNGERKERSKPRNTNRGVMGMENEGDDYGNGGVGAQESNGGKGGTIVTEQQ